ncbi:MULTISPECIES: hypothetical protein [Megasphaera]|uniref:Uncharacterized protein n=1 Tax=Megasphaera vaginalis (ex Srinivasan et al. 2021) TaxID=1111454 RepID=U7UBH6_9FIRM|nr:MULTISPECIES: hypothetical protein [Megasphaera]ERT56651.1 hypothetical protein HMPREF1250_0473 [Megasphaera vaginalis (ex Srinivasan et al. 2021)]
MIVMAAVDTALGLLFNGRRQSQDSVLRQHLLTKASGRLWLNAYSAAQFDAAQQAQLQIAEDFLQQAGPAEYCFVEDQALQPYAEKIEKVMLFHWNRAYPGDVFFDLALASPWKRISVVDFAGSSHEKITEEVYVR